MKIEHIATNVADPVAVAAWYCKYLGMRVVRHKPEPAEMHFLTDAAGSMWEIYRNPPNDIPDYAAMNPLQLHLAFCSEDPAADSADLIAAGATLVTDDHLPDGSHLVMLRDPWGLALQLCQRGTPFEA
ncbi:MAG: VOC family protein [Opitutaceae bacterium]|nr:VOC family protein [Opitutaceae bacterium]